MNTYTSEWWTIPIVDDWKVERADSCVSIYSPNGFGPLQISAYKKLKGNVSKKDLLETIRLTDEIKKNLTEQQCSDFYGFQIDYSEKDIFWRKWWLAAGNVILFATYNCELPVKDRESGSVNSMMASLKRK